MFISLAKNKLSWFEIEKMESFFKVILCTKLKIVIILQQISFSNSSNTCCQGRNYGFAPFTSYLAFSGSFRCPKIWLNQRLMKTPAVSRRAWPSTVSSTRLLQPAQSMDPGSNSTLCTHNRQPYCGILMLFMTLPNFH